jgi:HAAS
MDDPLVTDYLDRLRAAAASLPLDRRGELVDDVRGHIEMALTTDDGDETVVDTVLARLGSPEEIVAAEIEAEPVPAAMEATPGSAPVLRRRPHATVEFKAFLLLTVGAVVLPFIGPLIAVGYIGASARWTTVQKRTATIAVVGLLFIPAWLVLPMLMAGEITAVVNNFAPLLALVPLAGFLTAAYLAAVLYLELAIVVRPEA